MSAIERFHDRDQSPFDRIKQIRPDGTEFWSARQLQSLMAYGTWERFSNPLHRARQTASNTGMDVTSHFRRSAKVSGRRGPAREDYEVSRKAAYLVAMNGDPNKPEVAMAQAYFADRTHQAETVESNLAGLPDWAQQQIAMIMRVGQVEAEQQRHAAALRDVTARVESIEGAHGEFTALGYAKLNDLPTDRAFLSRLGKAASRVIRERGRTPRTRQDATFGRINVYPVWALDEATTDT